MTRPALLALALCAAVPAQSLVANLVTTGGGQPSSGSDPFYVIGNRAVFVANGAFGSELYATDGTPAGTQLLLDLVADGGSTPQDLTVLGNEVLFTAIVPGLGRELWKTDGTTAGTVLVKDIRPGQDSSSPDWLVSLGGVVYFSATDGSNGVELWRTDGTEAGTILALDIQAGSGSSSPDRLTVVGNDLFFTAIANGFGRELWRTDSLASAAVMVADLSPSGSTTFTTTAAFGSRLLFGANAGSGIEPFVSDGTAGGTFQLADLEPGAGNSLPEQFTTIGGLAVFTADANGLGREPYVTDGTVAGTALLADLRTGSTGSNPTDLRAIGAVVCFGALGDTDGREPWRTDGTAAGTFLLADLFAGPPSANPSDFVVFGSELWFAANGTGVGNELFRTDGTTAGTALVADLVAGGSLNAVGLTAFGSQLLFRGSFGGAGIFEPCVTDGTLANTALLDDLAPAIASSSPALFTEVGNQVFFVAGTDGSGREPHVTDGTPGGTVLLADVQPGSFGSNTTYRAQRGSDIFFDGDQFLMGRALFVSDGTMAATVQLTATGSDIAPRGLVANGNLVVFSGDAPASGRELWVSDGSVAGTFELFDINPGSGNGILPGDDRFVTAGGLTYFLADDGTHGKELWATDGTAAGTDMVADLQPGASGSNPGELTALGNQLYFKADTPGFGLELWRTDGTAAGTMQVIDLRPGFLGSNPREIRAADTGVYFIARAGTWDEIWFSDGTAGGTVAVTDTGVGQINAFSDLTWTQAGLFFLHDDQNGNGRELRRTTGSLASTQLVVDVAAGAASGPLQGTLTAALGGTQLLFAANDLQSGLQLWRSDGTATNTQQVTTFGGEGYGAVSLGEFYSVGARTFFACDDGINGVEPWLYDPQNGGFAFVLPYGTACSGAAADPVIGANGLPTIDNPAFAVTVSDAGALTLAVPVGSENSNNINLGAGCRLLLDFPFVFQSPALTDPAGDAALPLPIPNDPTLAGLNLFFQWAVFHPGAGQFLGDFDLSGGLQIQLGN